MRANLNLLLYLVYLLIHQPALYTNPISSQLSSPSGSSAGSLTTEKMMQSRSSCDILLAARHRAMWLSFIRSVSSNSNANNRRPKPNSYENQEQQNVSMHRAWCCIIAFLFCFLSEKKGRNRFHDIDMQLPSSITDDTSILLQPTLVSIATMTNIHRYIYKTNTYSS